VQHRTGYLARGLRPPPVTPSQRPTCHSPERDVGVVLGGDSRREDLTIDCIAAAATAPGGASIASEPCARAGPVQNDSSTRLAMLSPK
jgi:hypothetical protein